MIRVQDKRASERRDTSRDGLFNRLEAYALSHFSAFWRLVMALPRLRRLVNKAIIDRAVHRAPARPHAFSSMAIKGDSNNAIADYASWESLSDRGWFARHLPVREQGRLPDLETVRELFQVAPSGPVLAEHSTLLFPSFAQWFTDGFLMTDATDRRRTHTSHHIDFNPLYGLRREEAWAIRLMSEKRGQRGRLKSETDADGEMFAPAYFDANGHPRPELAPLRPPLRLDDHLASLSQERAARLRSGIFAFAGERANSTPYTAMLNTLFLREHNRLASMLEQQRPNWDDERVFQTARNINTVLLIKIVVEEYINHISPYHFQLTADPSVAWHADWNKPNWIPIELNLLYRWHSLVPSHFEIVGEHIPGEDILFDNSPLMQHGLGKLMESATAQRAWSLGLMNTPDFLLDVEVASVIQGRTHQLASYNDYREAMGYPRVTRFEQITGDALRARKLRELYGDVQNIELFVGLLAEDTRPRSAVPALIGRMVALDAFSHALTHPLLSESLFNERTFTPDGMSIISQTSCLQDVLNRNSPNGPFKVSMTQHA